MTNKIITIIFGGLGGLQSGPNMLTELQQAHIPNMDKLMRRSAAGLLWPTPKGSVPEKEQALTDLLGLKKTGENFCRKFNLKACALVEESTDVSFWEKSGFSARPVPFEKMAAELKEPIDRFNFFVLYVHRTEVSGLTGDYYPKLIALEEFDKQIEAIRELDPAVLVITGDSSVPTELKKRSWHPAPVMLHSRFCRYDDVMEFDELSCRLGALGHLQSRELMPIILANAGQNNEE